MYEHLLFCITVNTMLSTTLSSQLQLNTTNITTNDNWSSKQQQVSTTEVVDHQMHRCTYHNLQYCHPYIRNIFLLYTGIGGWVLFGIVVGGILLQIHFVVTGRNTQGMVALRKRELKYEMAQMRRSKKNSFKSKWAAEMNLGRKSSE